MNRSLQYSVKPTPRHVASGLAYSPAPRYSATISLPAISYNCLLYNMLFNSI